MVILNFLVYHHLEDMIKVMVKEKNGIDGIRLEIEYWWFSFQNFSYQAKQM